MQWFPSRRTSLRNSRMSRFVAVLALIVTLTTLPAVEVVRAESAASIDRDVDIALDKLYTSNRAASMLSEIAKGILVFPNIIKGGLIIGGQYGTGALRVAGQTTGYYQTMAASYGLQIGAQSFGYAMFFMTDEGLSYLERSQGWEVGVGPTLVVMDEGLAKTLSTSSAKDDIYVFFFNQKGLMAGIGIQGSKISPYQPDGN